MSSTCESCGSKLTTNQIESGYTSCVECSELWHERLCSDEVKEPHAMRKGNTRDQDIEIHKLTHGGTRQGSGRPPVEEIRKNHSVKFTDTEWSTIRQLATAAKQTISDYIRTKAIT